MGDWKEVEVAGKAIRLNTIKWWAWEDLLGKKVIGERTSVTEVMRACMSAEDWRHWSEQDYDPDNKVIVEQRQKAVDAMMEVNPKLFPKQVASQTKLTSGEQSTGSQPTSDTLPQK